MAPDRQAAALDHPARAAPADPLCLILMIHCGAPRYAPQARYTGAVYKASGWIRVGTTQGRGRYDRYNQYDKPRKDIWLRPLRKAGGEQTRPLPATPCSGV